MEMAAAAASAKRSRGEAAETQELENPGQVAEATSGEAPHCRPNGKPEQSRSQEPAPPEAGGDGFGGGVDRISGLPDAILGEIVSLLSTKEAARTQNLASRWRHVWRAAPLVLDATDLAGNGSAANEQILAATEGALAGTVSCILSAHPGPGRHFCIQPYHLYDRRATADAWLQSPALDNLQELDLWGDEVTGAVQCIRRRRHRHPLSDSRPPSALPPSAIASSWMAPLKRSTSPSSVTSHL